MKTSDMLVVKVRNTTREYLGGCTRKADSAMLLIVIEELISAYRASVADAIRLEETLHLLVKEG